MKKYLLALLTASALLAACGDEESSKNETTKVAAEEETNESIKDEMNVDVTFPAIFFEGWSEDEIIADGSIIEGDNEVKVNEDGTVTFKMSKETQEKTKEKADNELGNIYEEIAQSSEDPAIKEISYNKNFDEYDVVVDREQDGADLVLEALVYSSTLYQVIDGKDFNKIQITFNMIDYETNETYDTLVYPEDWEDEEITM